MSVEARIDIGKNAIALDTVLDYNSEPERYLQKGNHSARIINQTEAIIYNRVPKTGSRVILKLLDTMSRKHSFKLILSSIYLDYRPPEKDLLHQIAELQSIKTPWIFDRHIYFFHMNQTHQGIVPLYINIVREPISRCISWYYFIRYEHPREMNNETRHRSFDSCIDQELEECTQFYQPPYRCLQMPFFCGQEDVCLTPSRAALDKAKRNVVTEYLVVGLTEDMRSLSKVIEKKIPTFFDGVLAQYDQMASTYQKTFSNKKHQSHSERTAVRMENLMSLEIEFYKFVRKYFYIKHRSILDT